ncbi:MAG: DUF4143 domain-containing protein, partial [Malacoplasma sp.]|nr:DUF4143 domain-containing protein [Malacoplasma sp.]
DINNMKNKKITYYPRLIDKQLEDYLKITGGIYIKGPKWCGKTTSALQICKSYIKLSDPNFENNYRFLIETKPNELLKGETPRLISEWQVYKKIWNSLRTEIDNRQLKGQFILTGSSIVSSDSNLHSGVGRISFLNMRTMSLFESKESSGQISLKELFNSNRKIDFVENKENIDNLIFAICRGGWPTSVLESDKKIALKISYEYIKSVCESDLSSIDGPKRNSLRTRKLLKSYARNNCQLANNRTLVNDLLSNDFSFSERIFGSYLKALNDLMLIEEVEAWSLNIRSKSAIRSTNKRCFLDPSIGIAALQISPEYLKKDFRTLGFYFENLCIRDIRIYSQEIEGSVFYYRDKTGLESDIVLVLNNGDYALIEIKFSETLVDEACKNLLKIKKLLIENNKKLPSFMMVITAGKYAFTREDGIHVVPINMLKN